MASEDTATCLRHLPMISVVIPTRNPHRGRLARVLDALTSQTLPRASWELIVIDNGSSTPLHASEHPLLAATSTRIIPEPTPGLTPARLSGIHAARGGVIVFVDDDNVLASDYLTQVATHFDVSPDLAAAGGRIAPEWEMEPPSWTREFHGLLALRDLGPEPRLARGGSASPWPDFAPVGAGLAMRRAAAIAYATALARDPRRRLLDRQGASLASGGDNDLVFTTLISGGTIAYLPDLRLTHLIPAERTSAAYLGRLNRGIMRTWVRVLALHARCPWPPISPSTVPLRALRAWFRLRAWSGPAARVRWLGSLGQFEGQADLARPTSPPAHT